MNKNEFTKLVLDNENMLYRVSKSILINDADCEDAVSEAIIKAFLKRDSLREEKYFKTYLVRIVINECFRMRKRHRETIAYDEHFLNKECEDKDYSDLYDAVFSLDIKLRMPVLLHYIEGYSIGEIKEILKIPSGTVKSRLSRGRKILKSVLEED